MSRAQANFGKLRNLVHQQKPPPLAPVSPRAETPEAPKSPMGVDLPQPLPRVNSKSSEQMRNEAAPVKLQLVVKDVLGKRKVVDEANSSSMTLRQKCLSLVDPSVPCPSKRWGMAATSVSLTIFVLIILSVVVMMIDSLPKYYAKQNDVLFALECLCISVFTTEFLMRLILTEERLKLLKSFVYLIDFAAIVPFYLEIILEAAGQSTNLGALVFLRVIRLARIFRVLKLSSYSTGMFMVIESMKRSSEAITLLAFLLAIAVVLFSSMMFLAEQQEGAYFDPVKKRWYYADGTTSPFQSIFHTFWWAIVTLTTVGYGDCVPVTMWGKLVACTTIISGVLVLGFPVILITNSFTEVVREVQEAQAAQKAEELRKRNEGANNNDSKDGESMGSVLQMDGSHNHDTIGQEIPSLIPDLVYDTIIANFKLQDRIKPITYVGCLCPNEGVQLRYDPLFIVHRNFEDDAFMSEIVYQDSDIFVFALQLVLDDEATQVLAHKAVSDCGTFDAAHLSKNNIHARIVNHMTVSMYGLPDGCMLLTDSISSPGMKTTLHVQAPTQSTLSMLRHRLREISVHLKGSYISEGGDFEVTIPLYSME